MVIKQNTMLFSNKKNKSHSHPIWVLIESDLTRLRKSLFPSEMDFFFSHRDYIERMKTNHLVGPVVSHKSRSNYRVQNILQVSSYYAVHIMSTFLLYGRYHFFSSLCSVCSALILISQSKSRMRLGVEVEPRQRLR